MFYISIFNIFIFIYISKSALTWASAKPVIFETHLDTVASMTYRTPSSGLTKESQDCFQFLFCSS